MNLVLKVSQSPCTHGCKCRKPENGRFELFYSGFTPFSELRFDLRISVILNVTKHD